jgi:hypothetical protein
MEVKAVAKNGQDDHSVNNSQAMEMVQGPTIGN